MSMTLDLPQCQDSLREEAGADKNEGGGVGRDPLPKKCQSEGGPGLTFPNVKNDAGKHKSTKKSVFFSFGESVATPQSAGGWNCRARWKDSFLGLETL